MDTFTKEQVLAAYNNAPDFVRRAFNAESTTTVAVSLKDKFQLHVDKAGVLGKEMGYLLLGLTDPTAFMARLKANSFPEEQISEIVQEINQKIFMPLREQMRSGGGEVKQPVKPQIPPVPPVPSYKPPPAKPAAPAPRPVEASKPPGIVGWPPQTTVIPANPQLPPRPPQVAVSMPKYTSPRVVPPRPPMPAAPIQKPLDASRMLEDHEEPHIEFHTAPAPPVTPIAPPRPSVVRQPADVGGPPPQNLPGAMPGPAAPNAQRQIINKIPPPSTPPPASPRAPQGTAPVQPYSADPYREPIE